LKNDCLSARPDFETITSSEPAGPAGIPASAPSSWPFLNPGISSMKIGIKKVQGIGGLTGESTRFLNACS